MAWRSHLYLDLHDVFGIKTQCFFVASETESLQRHMLQDSISV